MRLSIPIWQSEVRKIRLGWPAALLALTLPALWPLVRPGFFISDDGLFHVYRIAALADALRQGVLYPRLFPDFGFGYGQAVLNFYAPLTYYPGALLALPGLNPATAAQITIALGFVLAALAMYGYARSLWGPTGGLLAAIAYTYFPYHLADAYVRGAIPEHFAFIWPPLILWAYTAAFGARGEAAERKDATAATGPRQAGPGRSGQPAGASQRFIVPLLWSALAWTGLVYTHNLTALMFAPVAVLYLLALAGWTGRWRRLVPAAGSLLLAVALSAPLWLPFLAESRAVGIALGPSDGYQKHLAPLAQAVQFLPLYRYRGQPGGVADHPVSWLVVVLDLLGLGLLLVDPVRRTHTRLPAAPIVGFGLALAVGSAFLVTLPALPIWRLLEPALAQLQYPWRFLALTALGSALVAGALPWLARRSAQLPLAGLLGLLLIGTALPGLRLSSLDVPAAEAWAPDRMWREDAKAGQVGATWTGEFLPLTVREQRWALGRPDPTPAADPAPQPLPTVRLERVGYGQATLSVLSAASSAVRLHQFHLPGWSATIDGQPAATYASGELGLVTVDVAAGSHRVALRFGPSVARTAGAVLATLGALAWAFLAWRAGRGDGCLRPVAGALLVLALALNANRLGLGQHTWQPRPAGAALGDVALLLGYDVAPARGEQALDVTLYWYALHRVANDYKAFVHLVGPNGQVAAQQDGDPGGGFTPTTRWRAGELIADRHRLSLPDGLPAGAYELKAGVYQSEPLQNLKINPPTADDRVDLGPVQLPDGSAAP